MASLKMADFIRIVGEQLGVDPVRISADSHLINDLGANSLAMVNIVAEVEELLDTEYDDLDFDDVHTIQDAFAILGGA